MSKLFLKRYNTLYAKTIVVFSLLICMLNTNANNIDSIVASLPLLKTTDAVVEEEIISVNISDNSYTYSVHKKIRFNNDNKLEYADIIIGYNKSTEVKFNYGVLYNAFGEEIKRIKKSDLKDIADMNEFATDQRMLVFEPQDDINRFPFTIEYDYEIKSSSLVNIPTWFPVFDYDITVKKSTYQLSCKTDNSVRYLEMNNAPKAVVNNIDKKTSYTWTLKNFQSIKEETYSPSIDAIAPYVLLAPRNISYNKFENKFENWEDFGLWISKLNNGRDSLPNEIKSKLIDLTKNEKTIAAKTDKIYKYLQSITRYISIQFGIGGFQPQFADKTLQIGYGDCKALSMLMVSMLKAVNIKSYYTLVLAGANENIIKDFPSNQFNHAIVCVPSNNDTFWLECTSQKNKFNYLSSFTNDRDVLVIAEKPFIAHTKSYNESNNTTNTNGKIFINEIGDAKCDLTVQSSFLNADYFYEIHNTNSLKDKEDLLTNYFNFKNINLENYKFSENDSTQPKISINTNITARNYATVAGKRLFIPLNRLNNFQIPFDNDSIRKLPFIIYTARKFTDTIEYTIPNGYTIESKDASYTLETKYGKYQYTTTTTGNRILYTRQFTIAKGNYEPNEFQALKTFFNDIHLKDGILLIIKREI